MLGDVLSGLDKASPGALIVSAVSMVTLVGGKVLNNYFKKQLPMPVPWELILVSEHAHIHADTHSLTHKLKYTNSCIHGLAATHTHTHTHTHCDRMHTQPHT